jgi:predicted glycosyltransferase/CheY-like chemotaxis protein
MSGILLLEDEPIIARNICRTLQKHGHAVTHAASAQEAQARLLSAHYDLVLADVNLGDGDGIDVLGAHGPALSDVPIIIMTGQDTIDNRLRAEGLAVSAFLSKPFAMSRLAELIGALLAETGKLAGVRRGPSVMMYSHDTIGLGHMRRNTAIAQELVARVPGISVLMLVGCPAGMIFEPHQGIDYVKLPSLTKLGRGRWQAGSLRIDAATTRAMRAGILERVIETFQPDVFLVDHEPAGVWDELVEPIRALRARGGTRVVLGLRDILDDPDRVARAWAGNGVDRVISSLYDDVLIYGNARFYPSDAAYGLEALRPGHVRYCGAVTTVRTALRDRWTGPPRRVLVSGGGGRDAYALLDTALAGLEALTRSRRPEMTLIAGPLMDAELSAALAHRAEQAGATFKAQVTDLPARLAASDLFVTMGGYNSVTEALATGCPAVVVPRVGPSDEQRIRAERLQALGLATVIWRHELTPARMAAALTTRPPTPIAMGLSFDGASVAAAHLVAVLAAQSARPEVQLHA